MEKEKKVKLNKVKDKNSVFDMEYKDKSSTQKRKVKRVKKIESIPDNFTTANVDNSTVKVTPTKKNRKKLNLSKYILAPFKFEFKLICMIFKYIFITLSFPFIFLYNKTTELSIKNKKVEEKNLEKIKELAKENEKTNLLDNKQEKIEISEIKPNFIKENEVKIEEKVEENIDENIDENKEEQNIGMILVPKTKIVFPKFLFPIKWLYLGILFEINIIYMIFKYSFITISFPFVFLYNKNNELTNKAKENEEKTLERLKQLAEEHGKDKLIVEKQNIEEKVIDENKPIIYDENNKDFIKTNAKLVHNDEPKTFKEKLIVLYHNLPIVRNIELKKKNDNDAISIKYEGEDAHKSPFKVVYEYRAKDANGKYVIDYFDAFSKVEVYSYLLNEGFKVYSIRTSKAIQLFHGSIGGSGTKFKSNDMIFFLTQLSTYLKAGIPLIEALKILSRQYAKNKSYQKVFRKMIYDLSMGESFSTALENAGSTFPRLLINMIKSSELTGELPDTLDHMANYYTETHKTKQQMITAITYPAIVFTLTIAVFIFMMLFIVPKFVDIYDSMDNVAIPGITQAMLKLSNFLKANVLLLLLGVVVIIVIFIYLYKNIKSFRSFIQTMVMNLPVFGNIIKYNEVTIFTQTLGTLLSHNVFITDSMEILNKITNNEIYKKIILDTISNIAKGDKISTAFEHWAFPVPAYEMIVTGERTGQLPEMMEKVGEYYQELHRNEVARIKTFLEPILIIFLTALVGVIVLSIVMPMFNMYTAIEKI